MNATIDRMIPPSQKRPTSLSGGTIQIMVTRACDLACRHCSQGSNLAGKPVVMSPGQFDEACRSLEGYWGVVGMFGGNPAVHPEFTKLCEIMRSTVPYKQRGIWTNNLMGKAAVARITFNPQHSNLNMHQNVDAANEVRRDWPEATPFIRGESLVSLHGSPWVSPEDLGVPEDERWKLVGDCDVNRYWSAMICVVRGQLRSYFCELAGAQAMLHEDNPDWRGTGKPMPDTGLPVVPGWWKAPIAAYTAQVSQHCHQCGMAMRRPMAEATSEGLIEYTATHEWISRPKRLEQVPIEIAMEMPLHRGTKPATSYLPGITPGYHGG